MFFKLLCFLLISNAFIPKKPAQWDNWSFSEKIYWRGKNPDPRINYGLLVDKLLVKKLLKKHTSVAKVLYSTDDPSTITTALLPKTYLMKANNASGRGLLVRNGTVVARKTGDMEFTPRPVTDKILQSYAKLWLSTPYKPCREKQYSLVKPTIFFEEYLEKCTMDIEFYCFYGQVRLICVYFGNYQEAPAVSFYDEEWNLLEGESGEYCYSTTRIDPPKNFDKILALTKKLTQNMDHVRVDYFLVDNEFYFGEFTFTSFGGRKPFNFTDSLDRRLGTYWTM